MILFLIVLVVTLPISIITSVLIKLESDGPIIYKQERVGRDGKVFSLYKFRSMRQDAEKESGPIWAKENDPRVTRVGRISGVSGNDLKITGKIDVDNDGTYDYTGTLLTGEITNFGYQYVTVGQSLFNFAFDVTGGALASLFPTEHDGTQLGGDYFTTENTNFNGSWLTSSYGYKVKHDTFPIPNPEPTTWILLLIGMIGMTTVTRKRVRL